MRKTEKYFKNIILYIDEKGEQKPVICNFRMMGYEPLKENAGYPEVFGLGGYHADFWSLKEVREKSYF